MSQKMNAIAEYVSSSDSEREEVGYREESGAMASTEVHRQEPANIDERRRSMKTLQTHLQQPPIQSPVKQSIRGGYVSKRKRTSTTGKVDSSPPPRTQSSPSEDMMKYMLQDRVSYTCNSKRGKLSSGLPRNSETLSQEHCKPVISLDWHGTNGTLLLSCSLDGTTKIWDISRKKRVLQTSSRHDGAAISCGKWITHNRIATGGYDNHLLISDVEKNKVVLTFDHKDYVSSLLVNPSDSNMVFSGDYGSNVFSWDLRSGKMIRQYKGAGGRILDMAILQSGKELLASADIVRKNAGSQALRVWEIDSGVSTSQQIYPEPYTCPCLRVHPYRNEFYAQSNANYIVIFSSRAPYKCNKRRRFESHRVDGNKVQFDLSPDGTLLCSASADGQVLLYNCETTRRIKTLCVSSNSTSCCVSVAWNPHASSEIAVSDWDSNVYILR